MANSYNTWGLAVFYNDMAGNAPFEQDSRENAARTFHEL